MSLYWGHHGDGWEPQGGERKPWRDLTQGDLIAGSRKIWRIVEVRDVPVPDWDEHDRDYYGRARQIASRAPQAPRAAYSEETWPDRPLYLIVVPVKGGKRHHTKVRPYASFGGAWVLHPHYPVCSQCGEPWPCQEIDITQEVARESAKMDDLASIMPGCCWGCKEPVTARQGSIDFPGENMLLPTAPPPVFHTRHQKGCRSAAISYEKKWVPAVGDRRWRLSCPGKLVVHVDGHECSEDPLCPRLQAMHGTFLNHRWYAEGRRPTGCLRCVDALARGEVKDAQEPPPLPGQGTLRLDGGEGA